MKAPNFTFSRNTLIQPDRVDCQSTILGPRIIDSIVLALFSYLQVRKTVRVSGNDFDVLDIPSSSSI